MSDKLNYTPETILNIKFSPAEKGYDSLEVDKIFDSIIEDYSLLLKNLENEKNASVKQKAEIEKLKKDLEQSQRNLSVLKQQFENLSKLSGINADNIDLLHKVSVYEKALWKKGINPEKLLSDPDNC